LLGCKEDCDFQRILSVPSNFTASNSVPFALTVVSYLQPDVAAECSEYFSSLSDSLQNATADDLLNDIGIQIELKPKFFY